MKTHSPCKTVHFHELRSDGKDRLESGAAAASSPLPAANTTKIQRRGEAEIPCSGASKNPHAVLLLADERERRGGGGGRRGEART